MRIYITGIKDKRDGELAAALGASAVGIKIGYKKNEVHPETARDIFINLPVFISRAGIFADEKRYNVQELVTFCRLDTLHFVGNEQPEDIKRYNEHIIKTFEKKDINSIKDYDLKAAVINLHCEMPEVIEREVINKQPIIFSGSLTLSNWVKCAQKYCPYAVQLDLNNNTKEFIGQVLSI